MIAGVGYTGSMKARIAAAAAAIVGLVALTAVGHAEPPPGPGPTAPAPDWLVEGSDQAPGPDELNVRWLGTAGFEIRSARAAILIDPYYSRLPILKLLGGKVKPDMAAIAREIHPAQGVFVSHGHFDHLLDAPEVARKLNCPLYTSSQGEQLAEAEGLPAALRKPIVDGTHVQVGDLDVEAVQSKHSDMITQWLAGGEMTAPAFPMGFTGYKNGPTYGFLIKWRGRTLYHNGTAQIVESAIRGRHADVVLMCVSGWTATEHLWERVGAALTPRVLVPMHDDDFFKPISEGFVENPLAKRQAAFEAMRAAMPDTAIVTVGLNGSVRLRGAEPTK
ncbi:MAG: hypothetical protein JWM80_4235 [Cyanobacteria bacterium RYN_339]|nr:hypothetical protein [Cyanobacteria bacterium RYN_339]